MGSNPDQRSCLAALHRAKLGHADDQAGRHDGADTGQAHEQVVTGLELEIGLDELDQLKCQRPLEASQMDNLVIDHLTQITKGEALFEGLEAHEHVGDVLVDLLVLVAADRERPGLDGLVDRFRLGAHGREVGLRRRRGGGSLRSRSLGRRIRGLARRRLRIAGAGRELVNCMSQQSIPCVDGLARLPA